jgi:glutathione S-transferase
MPKPSVDTSDLTLYHMEYCPYCLRVRDVMEEMGLEIQMKDTSLDPAARRELIAGGGMSQVPCLRMQHPDGSVQWMYESQDIIRYLRGRFP